MRCELHRIEAVGDELLPGGDVDTHIARELERRRGDADVDLLGARVAQQPDDGTDGVATHDRVVDEHDAAPGHLLGQRAKLHGHAQAAQPRVGLDERAPHVPVLAQYLREWQPGLGSNEVAGYTLSENSKPIETESWGKNTYLQREAVGSSSARLGDGRHNVGLDRRLTPQLAATLLTHRVHGLPCNRTVSGKRST